MALRAKCPCCNEWIENILMAYEVSPGMYIHDDCLEYFPVDLYTDMSDYYADDEGEYCMTI